MINRNKYIALCLLIILHCSCEKGYLDIKSDQSLLVPSTLADLRSLLDNPEKMNYGPGLHIISTDDYQINTSGNLASLTAPQRNSYLWKEDIFEGVTSNDWNLPYQQVFYANVVLDALGKIKKTSANETEWNDIRGSALFYRAMAFSQLANEFASPFDVTTSSLAAGIPLKLSSDVTERPGRGNVGQVYSRIISDLDEAASLLPSVQEKYLTRPSKTAAHALLARVYLITGDYENALKHANESLNTKSVLLDYNTLSVTSSRPVSFTTAERTEVIYWQWMYYYSFASSSVVSIAPDIVSGYNDNDLRKAIFLRDRNNGIYTFKGNYSGSSDLFTGLATDEVFLIKAECLARNNDPAGAMEALNMLMKMRWRNTAEFDGFTAVGAEEALSLVLEERRKELVTRGLRWSDLRRLNKDDNFKVVLTRNLDNIEYSLYPDDSRYVFPIPQNEIDGSGIEQNHRKN